MPNKIYLKIYGILFLFAIQLQAHASHLIPGFNKNEYIETLMASARQLDTPWKSVRIPESQKFKLAYRSPVVGLLNRWDLWTSEDSIAIINIRGTVGKAESWLENFYCTMVPATGTLQLSEKQNFNYKLAQSPHASVHIGWLTAVGFMSEDLKTKINEYYKKGFKNFIISGHSQGGAIAFLVRSYLEYQKPLNNIPNDVVLKTYCSAGPKPGNLYYSYDYDFITQNGWGFNVINQDDWVPETPFSIQMLSDMNYVNPLADAKKIFRKQNLFARLYLNHVYNKMNRTTRKANRTFKKFLGKKMYAFVKKSLKHYDQPEYAASLNYQRAGTAIILRGDNEYFKLYPDNRTNYFIHHMPDPYYYLITKATIDE